MAQTVSQEITAKLTRRIVDKHYPVGSRLPTERELAQEFGVNRHVIREALKRLEAVGLVRIRQGSGILVENVQLTGDIEMFEYFLRRDDGSINLDVLREVLEFRQQMVGISVRLAASRRSEEEMGEIRRLFSELLEDESDAARAEEVSHRLFQVIAQATHNRIYELVFNTTGRIMMKLRALIDIPMIGREQSVRFRDRILEAFEERDGTMAELWVMRYLETIEQNLEQQFSEAGTYLDSSENAEAAAE